MRRLALLIGIVAWATGCGDQPPPQPASAPAPVKQAPDTAQMSCQSGWSFSDKYLSGGDWREKAVIAGPITMLRLNDHADRDFRRARSLYTKVLLQPQVTTTVAVAEEDSAHVSLTTLPPNGIDVYVPGDRAIRFEGCPPREDDTRKDEEQGTGYAIAVMVAEPRCATFEITPRGAATIRRSVGFGVQDCA